MKQRYLVCLFILLVVACDAERSQLKPEAIIYTASAVLTMNSDSDVVTAVAVSGGKIIAVGNLDDVKAQLIN